jgi:FkbM family methyltransferase
MLIQSIIKESLNAFFMGTVSHKLVNYQKMAATEYEVWKHLKTSGFSPTSFVDVGAAVGAWSENVLKLFPSAQFLLVDPLKENEHALKRLVDNHSNLRYWMGALGRNNGELEFYVHGEQSSMFSSDWGKGRVPRRVQMTTLDELITTLDFGHVDALKLDVQGAELEILSGGLTALQQCNVLQVEVTFRKVYDCAPLAHNVIHFLAEQGFRIYDIAALNKRKDCALLQADIFFVRTGALFEPEKWDV